MKHPLWEFTQVRFLEFIRDPEAIFWVFVFPVILALVLGTAFKNPQNAEIRVAVTGVEAQNLAARLSSSGSHVKAVVMGRDEAYAALRSGRADLLARAESGSPSRVVFRFDPARPGSREARLLADKALQESFGRKDKIAIASEESREKGGRYIDFLIPALIGLNIMGGCMWGMGYAIVDFRRKKLIKRFAVTPMHRSHFLLAFVLSRVAFVLVEAGLLLGFGILVFGFTLFGSLAAFAVVCVLTLAAFAGIALLIAARATSTESASGWMNLVQVPMWLFSGSFFSNTRFPDAFQPAIRLLPLTAFNDAARAILNEGASLASVTPQCILLAAWGCLGFFLALKIFRWQ